MKEGMKNFMTPEYKGVSETWNVLQHEVKLREYLFFYLLIEFSCLVVV